ncbi:hypothetical protein EG359_12270 [Chryseobacterium joostei]|uniref:Uncharacterized protein n=1 Tax=Chryseobacterium joostei TaxID=112234 RepID=A0A1N7IHL4_9FLAO|nr:hypothetical protein [Chryseobacterium joostei]AZB00348.1 hypothetical protein EG359_12270 [Chryseobacterium joostei]SIS36583.1 hypothetical protein SAMN05421768_105384 [Chryseobacterium joostei]
MNKSEEKINNPLPKNKKWTPWKLAIFIIWLVGLLCFYHGIGYSKYESSLDFKAGYFVIGILILAPIYYYIYSIIESEKGFPLENFNKEIVIQDIKRHKITENVDLSRCMIENYVFGVGKDQNGYANIFYNKEGIEFVKSKITIEYIKDKSLITLTAFTNIDKTKLNEILQQYTSTKVHFDKYIPTNYYLDLEFLEDWEKQNESGK